MEIVRKIKELWLLPKKAKALKSAEDMWYWIATRTYSRNKVITKKMYFEENGIKEVPKCECYLCEYVEECFGSENFVLHGCERVCPVKEWVPKETKESLIKQGKYGGERCSDAGSVFENWESLRYSVRLLERIGEGERRDYVELASAALEVCILIHKEHEKVWKNAFAVEVAKLAIMLVALWAVSFSTGYFLIPFVLGW